MSVFDPLKLGHYRAIAADPPWHFRSWSSIRSSGHKSRDVSNHYSTMSVADMRALPVRELAAPDCHLFLWVTGPCLPMGLDVMQAWGFRYSGIAFTWAKLKRSFNPKQLRVLPCEESDFHFGLGLTTRKNAEFVLLGRRGNCRRNAKNVRELILSPVREHSRKPVEFFERVVRYCDGPYVELFAREERAGWDSWGNEADKFKEVAYRETAYRVGDMPGGADAR